ncbi:MAG TPA: CCA tRNA nucleotidyltransferase [Propioniciclava sp.]|uniref:CCA tRNA nucleotidyltransferase n=1 Tax=Propioniciclava sp. TaxID=2038686 RepID=UPI002CACF4BE|nr:CCA tRNA nucleotidyltransferase [Propioniciclava sp.]HRL49788.1 CCA tRNA nucleotidyltransferase [Propioniciclava sp.]HRL81102.1 CCA tRNA nucleotidyltransferase [Propioniciclava sp.]
MASLSVDQRRALEEAATATPTIRRVADAFAAAGYDLHLVGGPVRDALMGRGVHDLDFTTAARPDVIETILGRLTPATWDIGRAFGTIGASLNDDVVEVTTYRADSYDPSSRKPTVEFGDDLTADLVRRDFTVNAMALSVVNGAFADPHGGLEDLADQVLRTPSPPEVSFGDDPLRMMRAARFTSQLGFTPVPEVVAAMTAMAERIDIISAERVRDELSRLLLSDAPRQGLDLLVRTGLADRVLPELSALVREVDEHGRHKDIYQHTLTVLEQSIDLERARGHEPDLVGRLAAILHDVGKPATKRFESGGKVTFHHHDVVGAKMAKKRLTALRYSTDDVKAVAKLVDLHLRFHGYADADWTDAAVRRYVRDAGDQLERLHILTRADCTTRNQRKANRLRTAYEQLEWRIDELSAQEELDAMRPDLDGTQIMEILGIKPGRVVGKAYAFLLERRMDEGPLGAERAREELLAWWAQQPESDGS